jgi:7-carboxy-7-deazaguanine synthase
VHEDLNSSIWFEKRVKSPASLAGNVVILMTDASLRVTEIFYSVQGEARTIGLPTVFVRLTGCPLRCNYCDSEYAFFGGERFSLSNIVAAVEKFKPTYVCVTGGEPLAQPNCLALLSVLCDQGYQVSLETSGALDIGDVDCRVSIVMDLKAPSSGEVSKNRYSNIALLKAKDQIKFVLGNREDYEWASFKIDEFELTRKVGDIIFSPIFDRLAPRELAEWILQDRLSVRFQIQLHKFLWGDKPGV